LGRPFKSLKKFMTKVRSVSIDYSPSLVDVALIFRKQFSLGLVDSHSEAIQNHSFMRYLSCLAPCQPRIVWPHNFTSSHDTVQDAAGNPQDTVLPTHPVLRANIDDSRFANEHSPCRVTTDAQHVCDLCD
jgi:hypothetical protein